MAQTQVPFLLALTLRAFPPVVLSDGVRHTLFSKLK